MNRFSSFSLKISRNIVCVISGIIMLFLFINSIIFTEKNDILFYEKLTRHTDNILVNILGVLILLLVLFALAHLLELLADRISLTAVVFIMATLMFVVALVWALICNLGIEADQREIIDCAISIANGDLTPLMKGNYLSYYQHQLGYALFVRAVFKVFGTGSLLPFRVINAVCMPLILLSICAITYYILNKKAVIYAALLSFLCIPLLFYTNFIYGDIPSFSFSIIGIALTIKLMRTGEKFLYALIPFPFAISVLLKSSGWIFIIAMVIILVINSIIKHRMYYIVAIATVLLTILAGKMVYLFYPSFVRENKTMPSSLWIAMGLQESDWGAGWENGYSYKVFSENDWNAELSNQIGKGEIKQRLKVFASDMGYFFDFFYRKIETQWNCPMFQSLEQNRILPDEMNHFADLVYRGSLHDTVEKYTDFYQIIIYGLTLAMIVFMMISKNELEDWLLAVVVIGGFLFSIIWEAKSRYVFIYYVAMIPYAAVMLYRLKIYFGILLGKLIKRDTHYIRMKK